MLKFPKDPAWKVALSELVIAGAWLTVSVKAWAASGERPFVALMVNSWIPPVPFAGFQKAGRRRSGSHQMEEYRIPN